MGQEIREVALVKPSHWETALVKTEQIRKERKQAALDRKKREEESRQHSRCNAAIRDITKVRRELFEAYFGIDISDSKQARRFTREELAELTQALVKKIRPWAYLQRAMSAIAILLFIAIPIIAGIFGFSQGTALGAKIFISLVGGIIGLFISCGLLVTADIQLADKFNSKNFYFAYQVLKKYKTEEELEQIITPT